MTIIEERRSTLQTADSQYLLDTLSLRHHAFAGLASLVLLVGGLGGWAMLTRVSGAVVSSGVVVVEGGSRLVQHQEGGIVKQILAQNEDSVTAGQLLVTLDDTATRANLDIVLSQLREVLARQARRAAETSNSDTIVLAAIASNWPPDPELSGMLGSQEQLRQRRKASLDGQMAQLGEQISQQDEQIAAFTAEQNGVKRQLELTTGELTDLEKLLTQGLVQISRVNEMRRSQAQLEGDVGRLAAQIAGAKASIAELKVARARVDEEFQAKALEELATANQSIAELWQKRVAAQDRLARLEIRAPFAGVVHQSVIQTVGGIVEPGQVLMQIVPQESQPLVDTRISPLDIEKLHVDQDVVVHMASFEARFTPELKGKVKTISPDLARDPVTGAQFYVVRVELPDSEIAKLPPDAKLIPGMPAESFIQTEDRTVWSYLMHPITEQIARSMRD